MTDRLWIFPALLCAIISFTFSEGMNSLGLLLCGLWLIRILFLKQRGLFFLSLSIGFLFTLTLFLHVSTNQTHLDAKEKQFVFYPKQTTIQIDGDQMRMEGAVLFGEMEEATILSYTFQTEEEKEKWLHSPPTAHLYIEGELVEPAKPSNFYQFNYRKYLKRKKVHWQLRAASIQTVDSPSLVKPHFHFIEAVRQAIFAGIDRVFNETVGSYIRILFFADDRDFSDEALQQYRALGVVHLFSISGFHISYLAQLLRKGFLRIGVTHERTNLALVFLLPLYGFLAGFGISVFRAVCQNVFLTVSRLRKQPMDTVDAWALTMLLALFLNPYIIYQIAFQLSYLLSGLFILMGKQKWISDLPPIFSAFLFSALSFLGSLPILTVHFFEISWVTVWANLLFIPFFTSLFFPALLLLFFVAIFFWTTPVFDFFQLLMTLLIETIEQLLTIVNEAFDFSLVTGRLPAMILLMLILCIFTVVKSIENRRRISVLSLIGLVFCLFYYQIVPLGYVAMLDVGQGESIVIRDPQSKKVTLIDTGGQVQWGEREDWQIREEPFSIGADQVVPALKALGISEIDRLYLTHADVDHFGEMRSIGEQLTIKEVAGSLETLSQESVLEQLHTLPQANLVLLNESQKMEYPTHESVAILPMENSDSKNNQSLVLYVKLGEDTWLFTGDIEKEAEQQLIQRYPNLHADYLKVAHHGSQTSSTTAFLEHVQPSEAWISAGKQNTFGHPNKEVIERLREKQVAIYTTSEQGALMKWYIKLPGVNTWRSAFKTVHTNWEIP